MAFNDPVDFSPTGDPEDNIELPRVATGNNESVYRDGLGVYTLSAKHNYAGRTRRVLRLDTNKITPDPFIPSNNTRVSMSVYTVFDLPPAGFSAAEQLMFWNGLNLAATENNDLIEKFLGGQS